VNVAYPLTILSDLHVGHPASYLTDPEALAPLLRDTATVVFNGDTVEMLWVGNRDRAQEQLEAISQTCLSRGIRPVFLNGNHDPVVSSANYLDLCDGAVLVTHGDILFHEVAPWSWEARVVGPEHTRLLKEMDEQARTDLHERLVAAKRASLRLEMHEPRRAGRGFGGLALALWEAWPPWRALKVLYCWAKAPGLAAGLARQFRPRARVVIIGHTHYAGVWQRSGRVVINTGSFLPFSGRSLVRVEPNRVEVWSVVPHEKEWRPGHVLWSEEVRPLEKALT